MIAASVESENEPLFWYLEYWMQEMYMDGIERVVRIREKNRPRQYTDESRSKRERKETVGISTGWHAKRILWLMSFGCLASVTWMDHMLLL